LKQNKFIFGPPDPIVAPHVGSWYDGDSGQNICRNANLNGGNYLGTWVSTYCCGDDFKEDWGSVCTTTEVSWGVSNKGDCETYLGLETYSCCNGNQCVGPDGRCYNQGVAVTFYSSGNDKRVLCYRWGNEPFTVLGWGDCDSGSCSGCNYITAGESGVGEYDTAGSIECCGDDANEFRKCNAAGTCKCCNSNYDVLDASGNCVSGSSLSCSDCMAFNQADCPDNDPGSLGFPGSDCHWDSSAGKCLKDGMYFDPYPAPGGCCDADIFVMCNRPGDDWNGEQCVGGSCSYCAGLSSMACDASAACYMSNGHCVPDEHYWATGPTGPGGSGGCCKRGAAYVCDARPPPDDRWNGYECTGGSYNCLECMYYFDEPTQCNNAELPFYQYFGDPPSMCWWDGERCLAVGTIWDGSKCTNPTSCADCMAITDYNDCLNSEECYVQPEYEGTGGEPINFLCLKKGMIWDGDSCEYAQSCSDTDPEEDVYVKGEATGHRRGYPNIVRTVSDACSSEVWGGEPQLFQATCWYVGSDEVTYADFLLEGRCLSVYDDIVGYDTDGDDGWRMYTDKAVCRDGRCVNCPSVGQACNGDSDCNLDGEGIYVNYGHPLGDIFVPLSCQRMTCEGGQCAAPFNPTTCDDCMTMDGDSSACGGYSQCWYDSANGKCLLDDWRWDGLMCSQASECYPSPCGFTSPDSPSGLQTGYWGDTGCIQGTAACCYYPTPTFYGTWGYARETIEVHND